MGTKDLAKVCSNCGIDKNPEEFRKHRRQCKSCEKAYYNTNREKYRETAKVYKAANKVTIAEKQKAYYEANKERIDIVSKIWGENNKEYKKMYRVGRKVKKSEYDKNYKESNKELLAKKSKLYYELNKVEHAKNAKHWRENNVDKLSEYRNIHKERTAQNQKLYRAIHKKDILNGTRVWRQLNPHINRAINAKRRGIKLSATPTWISRHQLNQIKSLYKQAVEFELTTGIKHHLDHIIPLTNHLVCGLHLPCNLQILTASENLSKSNKFQPYVESELDPTNLKPWECFYPVLYIENLEVA